MQKHPQMVDSKELVVEHENSRGGKEGILVYPRVNTHMGMQYVYYAGGIVRCPPSPPRCSQVVENTENGRGGNSLIFLPRGSDTKKTIRSRSNTPPERFVA
jgi:hypothetical protein